MKKAVRRTLSATVAAAMAIGLMTGCSSGKEGQKPAGEASGTEAQAAGSGQQAGTGGEQTTIKFWDGNWQEAVVSPSCTGRRRNLFKAARCLLEEVRRKRGC